MELKLAMMSAATATTVEPAASVEAAEARLPAGRIAASFSAMVVAAESAGAHVRLTARFAKTPRCVVVPVKRVAACTAAVNFSASRDSAVHVVCNAALTAPAVVIVAIVKCIGM
jgi:hypothetical protein